MAKIKKILYYVVIPIILILLIFLVIIMVTNPNWKYKLPNDYYIRKTSDQNVELVKKIDNKFYTEYETKQVGISSYIAEFQYNDNFIGVKTLDVIKEEAVVHFYLIDTKNMEIHGPYKDEETYLAVVGVWSKKVLGNWITTTENPNNKGE